MAVRDEVLRANEAYADDFGDRGTLALPPARRFGILTCMDARLDPAKYAGLSEGDAHVIRNAGGRASDDAIRSLVISYKLLGTSEWFVIHHTDCGMEKITDEGFRVELEEATGIVPEFPIESFASVDDSVRRSLERVRRSPFIPHRDAVRGFVYDVDTHRLREVE